MMSPTLKLIYLTIVKIETLLPVYKPYVSCSNLVVISTIDDWFIDLDSDL
jgi:hypothetical protein